MATPSSKIKLIVKRKKSYEKEMGGKREKATNESATRGNLK